MPLCRALAGGTVTEQSPEKPWELVCGGRDRRTVVGMWEGGKGCFWVSSNSCSELTAQTEAGTWHTACRLRHVPPPSLEPCLPAR